MTVQLKLRDGIVDTIVADHPYEILYTLYALGSGPPVLKHADLKARMDLWSAWLNLTDAVEYESEDDDDDDDGGREIKGDVPP